jgi:hypothetical protein
MRVLDSGGKTPIMKSGSGGFKSEGCGEADDSVRMMVLPAKTATKRQSKGFQENFYFFLAFHMTIRSKTNLMPYKSLNNKDFIEIAHNLLYDPLHTSVRWL